MWTRPFRWVTKELLDAAKVGKMRQLWEGPFTVAAVAGPNTYTLALPALFKCSPTVNVDLFKQYSLLTGRPPSPGPGHQRGPGGGVRGGAAPQPQDIPLPDLLPMIKLFLPTARKVLHTFQTFCTVGVLAPSKNVSQKLKLLVSCVSHACFDELRMRHRVLRLI